MQLSINLGYKGCKWTENKSKDKNKKLRKTNAPIHNEYIRKWTIKCRTEKCHTT